jgi:2-aminoethylphosphonate-pyruvate transaminase
MEGDKGKWRYTSPTHVVRAFSQALRELEEEGGIAARTERYRRNHRTLVDGMRRLGFRTLLPDAFQGHFITSFYSPESEKYDFKTFYDLLKRKGFVIYPGKVSKASAFRIGNIGDVTPADMERLLAAIAESMFWKE